MARLFLVLRVNPPALIDPRRPMGLDGISAERSIGSQISLGLGRNFQGQLDRQRTEARRYVLFSLIRWSDSSGSLWNDVKLDPAILRAAFGGVITGDWALGA